jgi:hypothetical protein
MPKKKKTKAKAKKKAGKKKARQARKAPAQAARKTSRKASARTGKKRAASRQAPVQEPRLAPEPAEQTLPDQPQPEEAEVVADERGEIQEIGKTPGAAEGDAETVEEDLQEKYEETPGPR